MIVTKSQIEQVKEFASLFFTLEQIAILTMIDLEELRREVSFGHSELNNAYWMGKLQSEVTIRKNIKKSAESGTLLAEEKMLEWLQEQNESE